MRKALASVAATLTATVVLSGCGETGAGSNAVDAREVDESAAPSSSPPEPAPTPSPSPTGDQADDTPDEDDPNDDAIEIEIEGDTVTPNGRRVTVKAGEPVTLNIESDRAGELHVHSSPEQELAFGAGKTTLELTIDRPGVVDIEEHEAGVVIVQLEVV